MHTYILLLGTKDSQNVQRISQYCERKQHTFAIFDTSDFGYDSFLYMDAKHSLVLTIDNQKIPLDEIAGVFWDRIAMPKSTSHDAVNIASMLQVFFTQTQLNWVNSWQAFQFHKTKPSQLQLAASLGATIPETYVGNDVESAKAFVRAHSSCIIKPVHGGQLTTLLSDESDAELTKYLSTSPVTLQTYISGTNVRSFVIGNTLYSAQISSPNIDFREDGDVTVTAMVVPRQIELLAVRIMRAFHMQWTAIDWRVTEQGEFVFLEANPAPRFSQFEELTGYPITQALFKLLQKVPSKTVQKVSATASINTHKKPLTV